MNGWGRRRRTHERGSVAIMMIAVIAISAACCVAVGRLGSAATERARADSAADAAALAAAGSLATGGSAADADRAARQVASANGAVLISCVCAGSSAVVTVGHGEAQGRARAVVDP